MSTRSLRVFPTVVCALLAAAALAAQTPESEPNNSAGTATPLASVASCQEVTGAISPANDVDYFSFTAPSGSRVWALVDTGAASSAPGFSRDPLLTLFDTNGTTVIETDDDDASSTNCDATVETLTAASIAGRVLAGGTYFLRVERSGGGLPISNYRLLVLVTGGAVAETEPNNTTATANPITTAGSPVGVRDPAINTIGDVDVFSVVATAGSTLFISVDQDPDKNGSGTDVVVELLGTDGTTILRTVDDVDSGGFPPPGSEALCFGIGSAGTYYVRVYGAPTKQVTGNYALAVAVCGAPAGATPTPTVTPTRTPTTIIGGPTATPTVTVTLGGPTPTPTRTATVTATGVATLTATASATPIGGVVPNAIPTLSFPMMALLAVALGSAAFLMIRRL